MVKRSLLIDEKDNVAVLLENASAKDLIEVAGKRIELREDISFGHKVALCDLAAEDNVYKYGEEIGYMLKSIQKGGWVHNHNMGCRRGT